MRDVPAHIRHYARAMRRSMTPEERRIWHDFLSCSPYHFRRQYPLGGYIADFYSHCLRLVIEIDGGQHFEQDGCTYDMKRTAYMQARRLRVLRFTNAQVRKEFLSVCEGIRRAIKDIAEIGLIRGADESGRML